MVYGRNIYQHANPSIGAFADFSAGAAAMTSAARHYRPDAAVAPAYAARYQLYGDINQAMTPVWERFARQQANQ